MTLLSVKRLESMCRISRLVTFTLRRERNRVLYLYKRMLILWEVALKTKLTHLFIR